MQWFKAKVNRHIKRFAFQQRCEFQSIRKAEDLTSEKQYLEYPSDIKIKQQTNANSGARLFPINENDEIPLGCAVSFLQSDMRFIKQGILRLFIVYLTFTLYYSGNRLYNFY